MGVFQVLDDQGRALDAHVELEGRELVVQSRGGTLRAANQRNADYGVGLRLLLGRLKKSALPIEGAWVDSKKVRHLPPERRVIFGPADALLDADRQFSLLSSRMKEVRVTANSSGGNGTKRIRIRLAHALPQPEAVLGLKPAPPRGAGDKRLPAETLSRVKADHIWAAVGRLAAGEPHPFGPSTDFDLVADDGKLLPPKAVFGLAAEIALGFTVGPKHFSAGIGTPCFRALSAAGFQLVRKGALADTAESLTAEDRAWTEGRPRLITHLRRERGSGLAAAKKESFKREHGKLFCESCGLDPETVFGGDGDACIEVHHEQTAVADMAEGHRTRIEDVKCLCANCHRVLHAQMRRAALA